MLYYFRIVVTIFCSSLVISISRELRDKLAEAFCHFFSSSLHSCMSRLVSTISSKLVACCLSITDSSSCELTNKQFLHSLLRPLSTPSRSLARTTSRAYTMSTAPYTTVSTPKAPSAVGPYRLAFLSPHQIRNGFSDWAGSLLSLPACSVGCVELWLTLFRFVSTVKLSRLIHSSSALDAFLSFPKLWRSSREV